MTNVVRISKMAKNENFTIKNSVTTATWMLFSPTTTCDPWAIYTAKSISEKNSGPLQLNEIQTKILSVLEETGGVEFPVLVERIGIEGKVVEREFAALRHIEKVRAEMRGDKKVMRLW